MPNPASIAQPSDLLRVLLKDKKGRRKKAGGSRTRRKAPTLAMNPNNTGPSPTAGLARSHRANPLQQIDAAPTVTSALTPTGRSSFDNQSQVCSPFTETQPRPQELGDAQIRFLYNRQSESQSQPLYQSAQPQSAYSLALPTPANTIRGPVPPWSGREPGLPLSFPNFMQPWQSQAHVDQFAVQSAAQSWRSQSDAVFNEAPAVATITTNPSSLTPLSATASINPLPPNPMGYLATSLETGVPIVPAPWQTTSPMIQPRPAPRPSLGFVFFLAVRDGMPIEVRTCANNTGALYSCINEAAVLSLNAPLELYHPGLDTQAFEVPGGPAGGSWVKNVSIQMIFGQNFAEIQDNILVNSSPDPRPTLWIGTKLFRVLFNIETEDSSEATPAPSWSSYN